MIFHKIVWFKIRNANLKEFFELDKQHFLVASKDAV